VSHHRLRAAAAPPATVDFLGFATDSVDRATYTFAGEAIGTPGNRRGVAVAVSTSLTVRTVSSITVDGESLSLVVADTEAFNISRLELWIGEVNTANSTGDIVVTWSGAANNCNIGVFEVHHLQSFTAIATDVEETDNTAMTGSVTSGGICIAAAFDTSSTTYSWTGDVADHGDSVVETGTLSVASAEYAAAATATATANSAADNNPNAILATFR